VASDAELLASWTGGDDAAGREFYRRYADRVARFFARKFPDEAAELVQRTFLKCIQTLRAGTAVTSPAGLLFAVARSELYDAFRRRKRDEARFEPELTTLEDLGTGLSQKLARREQERLLLAGLRRIPVADQIALELYYWEGLAMEDVALALDTTRSAAINRIHRARKLLRERMLEVEANPELVAETLGGFESWARGVAGEPAV
jgi:RNA polymerase sigma-70 factor (ECF subfamily)